MRRLALAIALFTLPVVAAPVPKAKPRDGLILLKSGYGDGPVRLFRPDGKEVAELPFSDAHSASVSPDGQQVAVIARQFIQQQLELPPATVYSVHIVPITLTDPDERGEPLVRLNLVPVVAWTPDGKGLYVSTLSPPPRGSGYYRPERVDLYDIATGLSKEQPKLAGHFVAAVSPDGKRLFAQNYRQAPEGYDRVILDRATYEPIDVGIADLTITHFVTNNVVLATRVAKGVEEHVFVNLATKKIEPVPVPKELTEKSVHPMTVLPSPDGRRLLYAWDEHVPAPPDWNSTAPCRPARFTVANLDGTNATTIFRPQINTRTDIVRAHWGTLEWR